MLLQEYANRISAITNTEILGFDEIKTKYNDIIKIPKVDEVKFEIKLKEIVTKSSENSKEKWVYIIKAKPISQTSEEFCDKFDKFYVSLQKFKNQ